MTYSTFLTILGEAAKHKFTLTHKVYFISPPRYLHDTFKNTLKMLAVVEVTMTWDVSIYLILMLSIEFGTFGFSNLSIPCVVFLVRCPGTKAEATKTDVGFLQLFRYL